MEEARILRERQSAVNRIEDMRRTGKLSEDEYVDAVLKVEAGYQRQRASGDPLDQMISQIAQGQSDAEVGKGGQQVDDRAMFQEMNDRSALLTFAVSSGDTKLASLAQEGSYSEVMRELRKPKDVDARQDYDIKSNYLRNMMPTLAPDDQARLTSILAAGKPEHINKAFAEMMNPKPKKKATSNIGWQERPADPFEKLAQYRRSSGQEF